MLGFMSSKRNGLDRLAVKHVLLSFRFAIIATLLVLDVALQARLVYTSNKHPSQVVGYAVTVLFFCLCILIDCSPHFPSTVQIFASVNTRNSLVMLAVCG